MIPIRGLRAPVHVEKEPEPELRERQSYRRRPQIKWTDELDAKILALSKEGKSVRAIGEIVDVGYNAVSGRLHRLKGGKQFRSGRKPK